MFHLMIQNATLSLARILDEKLQYKTPFSTDQALFRYFHSSSLHSLFYVVFLVRKLGGLY